MCERISLFVRGWASLIEARPLIERFDLSQIGRPHKERTSLSQGGQESDREWSLSQRGRPLKFWGWAIGTLCERLGFCQRGKISKTEVRICHRIAITYFTKRLVLSRLAWWSFIRSDRISIH